MLSHRNLANAVHCGWSEVEKNLDDFSKVDVPKSQTNIDWSDSDEESSQPRNECETIITNKLKLPSVALSDSTNNENTRSILSVNNLLLDKEDLSTAVKSLSPIICKSRKTIKRNYTTDSQLSPIFNSKPKVWRDNEYPLTNKLLYPHSTQELEPKRDLKENYDIRKQNSCRRKLMSNINSCVESTGRRNVVEQLNLISSLPGSSTEDYISAVVEDEEKMFENQNPISNGKFATLTKGSAWLKRIQHKTPEKVRHVQDEEQNIHQLDSTKKKLGKNGLASQLVRLVHYWKSDVMMFDHKTYNSGHPKATQEGNMSCLHSKSQRHLKFEVVRTKLNIAYNSFVGRLIHDSKIESEVDPVGIDSDQLYLVYCGVFDKMNIFPIVAGSKILIHSPWQELRHDSQNMTFIFSSYYKLMSVTPTSFKARSTLVDNYVSKELKRGVEKSSLSSQFVTVQNVIELPRKNEVISLGEAISQSNTSIDKFISVTLRVLRLKKVRNHKSVSKGDSVNFLIFGQDPSGCFLLLRLHSDSSDTCEAARLKSYVGSTRTFGGLINPSRITDTEMPSLFTLIKSLHRGYVAAITKSESLSTLLGSQLKRKEPTFIYVFHTSSKLLKQNFIAEEVDSIKLPHWKNTLEALKQPNGQRGSLSVDIVYFYDFIMYVTCRSTDSSSLLRIHVTKNCLLPEWMKCNGSVSMSVVAEDILVLDGEVIADQYSMIPACGERLNIKYYQLLEILPTFTSALSAGEICTVKGNIKGLNEETASTWFECEHCLSCEIVTVSSSEYTCEKCHLMVTPLPKYFLEVFIHHEEGRLKDKEIVIKLFQKTIEKLFKITFANDEKSPAKLVGVSIGPLIVVIHEIKLASASVLELPY